MAARRRALAAAVLLLTPLVAGCTSDGGSGPTAGLPALGSPGRVDVGTAALQAQRKAAGIAACPATDRPSAASAEPSGRRLPDVTLPCLGGGPPVDLAALRGPLVINFWAQWCVKCRDELPYFARLHRAGVDVLGVDFQDVQPGAALALAEQAGVSFPSVADPTGQLRAPLRVIALPTTLFVAADGTVTMQATREFTSYNELVSTVRDVLGVDV